MRDGTGAAQESEVDLVGAFAAGRVAGRIGQGRAIWMAAAFPAPFGVLLPLAEPGWRLWLGVAGAAVA